MRRLAQARRKPEAQTAVKEPEAKFDAANDRFCRVEPAVHVAMAEQGTARPRRVCVL
jgi:hypothetical protein